jgi:hypothetical protein
MAEVILGWKRLSCFKLSWSGSEIQEMIVSEQRTLAGIPDIFKRRPSGWRESPALEAPIFQVGELLYGTIPCGQQAASRPSAKSEARLPIGALRWTSCKRGTTAQAGMYTRVNTWRATSRSKLLISNDGGCQGWLGRQLQLV